MTRLGSLLAVSALALAATSPSAHAASLDVLVVNVSGTYSPALDTTYRARTLSMNGTASFVGTHGVLTTYSCAFVGTEIGTIAGGVGVMAGNCGPIFCNAAAYARAGFHTPWTCTDTIKVWPMLCAISFLPLPPATSAAMTCLGASAEVP